jgi:hypothetical protein
LSPCYLLMTSLLLSHIKQKILLYRRAYC